MPTVIRYVLGGRLGNRMFEIMLAHSLARRLGDCVVTGEALPEWEIAPRRRGLPIRHLKLGGHRVDIGRLRYLIEHRLIEGIETTALGCRMELLEPLDTVRALFRAPGPPVHGYGADTLVINVRADEILGARHKDYRPLPLAFFARLIGQTGLRPVFLGQIGEDRYSDALRARFPQAEFVPSRGPMADFETLRGSSHICVAVSTFSWLAAWLSHAQTIHLPLAGMLHPRQRADVDLLPLTDPRYRFHLLPHGDWKGTEAELAEVIGGEEAGQDLARDAALQLVQPNVALANP